MKNALAVLALALTMPLHAERTIVPVFAEIVYGSEASYGSSLRVTNLSSRAANVRIAAIYAAQWRAECGKAPFLHTLDPGETQWLSVPIGCRGVMALEVESDATIRADVEVSSLRSGNTWHYQRIDTAREWLPAGRDAIIPAVRADLPDAPDFYGPFRTNLFVVNPNDTPLHFDLHIVRRSQSEPSRDESHVVAPRSVAVLSIQGIRDRWCDSDAPRTNDVAPVCTAAYDLTVRGDLPYYASASTVAQRGDALFTPPAVINQP